MHDYNEMNLHYATSIESFLIITKNWDKQEQNTQIYWIHIKLAVFIQVFRNILQNLSELFWPTQCYIPGPVLHVLLYVSTHDILNQP